MTHELPLKAFWTSKSAAFKEEKGWEVAASIGDTTAEYWSVRKNAGLIDMSALAKIKVSGADRVNFLHNILTNDIKNLNPGDGCYAALLSATGKLLADMHVYLFPDHILLLSEIGREKEIISLLEKYIIVDDVQLEDVTDSYVLLSLQGPRAIEILTPLTSVPITKLNPSQHLEFEFGGTKGMLARESSSGEMGFDLWLPRETAQALMEKILDMGKNVNLQPVGFEASEILRIEAGIFRYGIEMDEELTLPETGLEKMAASETKGCYPGQEVVARTETYGGPNRKLTGLVFEKGPLPTKGDKIYSGDEEIGEIRSACLSPKLEKGIAIGLLKKGFFDPEVEITIKGTERFIQAKIATLPFSF